MPCKKVAAFAFDEATDLSDDARAILAYARRLGGEPFGRQEIVGIAPGAEWDPKSPWPQTIAKLDPIRELVRAGLLEEHDEVPVKSSRGRRAWKRWKLIGVDIPATLTELLDRLISESSNGWLADVQPPGDVQATRAEILRRFDRS